MTHREAHRVRTAHYDRIDQEASSRIMTREWRTATPRRDAPPTSIASGEHPALVSARLRRDAVVPGALAVACAEHDAEAGAYCRPVVRGVCGDRMRRRVDA